MTYVNERNEILRVAAYGLLFDEHKRMLVVRIAPGYTRDSEGMWTLPGGGLDFGEDPAAGAIREVAEETGLSAEITGFAFIDSYVRQAIPDEGLAPFQSIRIVYRMRVTGGDLRDETNESTDTAGWFALEELRTMPIVDLVQAALAHVEADNVAVAH